MFKIGTLVFMLSTIGLIFIYAKDGNTNAVLEAIFAMVWCSLSYIQQRSH